LKDLVDHGLSQTARLWPPVQIGFDWVHRGAEILSNPEQQPGSKVRRQYRTLLRHMACQVKHAGKFKPAIQHFLKVTKSYWPGLFHCYDVPDLPRTNNALEQLFGSTRCHERRCTGRKAASPSLVLRGSVRIVAGLGTRSHRFQADELTPKDLAAWRGLRAGLDQRRSARTLRYRFRRNPDAYLQQLEELLLKSTLPT